MLLQCPFLVSVQKDKEAGKIKGGLKKAPRGQVLVSMSIWDPSECHGVQWEDQLS